MGLIYIIRNITNNKCYIGQTRNSIEKRFEQHCRKSSLCPCLKNAINKYSKESFSIEILWEAENCTDEEINKKEIEYIQEFNTISPNGYNLTYGGCGCRPSDETRRRMSETHKGPNGRRHSDETKQKLSDVQKGRIFSDEHRLKISEACKRAASLRRQSNINRVITEPVEIGG
jgi:group I intron endonuclease